MKPKRTEQRQGTVLLAKRTIFAILAAFRNQGMSPTTLNALLAKAMRQVAERPARSHVPISRDSAVIGTALALWYRDPRYLTDNGRPKPLRLLGRKPSVEHLLRAAGLRHNTKAIARNAARSGLLVKAGRAGFLPLDRSARIAAYDDYLAEHIANGVLRLVETAHYNFTAPGKREPLLQRAAAVRALPKRLRKKFRKYVNEQGNSFVTNIDDWLETHSSPGEATDRRRRRHLASAGVYAFAYFDN